ncbi:hypothetical protein DPMN_112315 [Dreissena polymorpha]|uniref:Uncharacterized protein n=1 Tax=Dreissena polymorpha TaxID=45954 RepID=A0A9D4KFH2_DREPO|nr:hypothetical protein DPMN_112315 [Dreissena polymorpha]
MQSPPGPGLKSAGGRTIPTAAGAKTGATGSARATAREYGNVSRYNNGRAPSTSRRYRHTKHYVFDHTIFNLLQCRHV